MKINRIKPTKYRVGRYVINELELRQICLEVSMGLKPAGIKVKNLTTGNVGFIKEDGGFTDLVLISQANELQLKLLKFNHNKRLKKD